MKRMILTSILLATALLALGLTRFSLADGGCTSTIITKNDKKCVFTTFSCTDHQCISVGQPCQFCSEPATKAFCVTEPVRRCLELKDCDGCGVIVVGECEMQNNQLVCTPGEYTQIECLRDWCALLPDEEDP